MGQKINPHGLRVGIIKNWDSRWFARDDKFGETLVSDYRLREYLKNKLQAAGIPKIEIERDSGERVRVFIHCAKPGMVIGRGGTEIEKLRIDVERLVGKPVSVNVVEVKPVDMCAQLVAENIASQLEKRISFRRAMKTSIGRTMRLGAKGIKIAVSGRLGGAEIARSEHYHEGTIPLQTLRADIDYGFHEAKTTYGKIGVKVWIYKGEVLPEVARTQTGASAVPSTANSNDRKPRRDRRDGGTGGYRGPRNNNNGGGYNNNNNNNGNFQRRPQGQQGAPRPNNNPRPEGGAQ